MTTDDHAARGHDTRPHYPLMEETASGTVVLRLMVPADREAVHAFALDLPSHDLMFLRRDITQIEQIDAWLAEIKAGDITTVLAERDGMLLGYSSVERSPWSWSRHVAELRVVVAAEAVVAGTPPRNANGIRRFYREQRRFFTRLFKQQTDVLN